MEIKAKHVLAVFDDFYKKHFEQIKRLFMALGYFYNKLMWTEVDTILEDNFSVLISQSRGW